MNSLKEIQKELTEAHKEFGSYLTKLSATDFEFSPSSKEWNAGQHLAHIYLTIAPLRKVVRLPRWFIKWRIGKANRPSRDYEGVKERYLEKLSKVPKGFTNPFEPHKVMVGERAGLTAGMNRQIQKLNSSLNRFSENDLDTLITPHPLLGKVTFREVLFNVIFHVRHHQQIVSRQLNNK